MVDKFIMKHPAFIHFSQKVNRSPNIFQLEVEQPPAPPLERFPAAALFGFSD